MERYWQGSTRRETCPRATFSITNPTRIDLESNPHFMENEESVPYLQDSP
jgi:hypothetical protein